MSSNIQNVISTVFTARSGQALAQMRQYSGGLSQIGRDMSNTARHSGVMNNQLRALGTTLRYAFAGSVVFGVASMGRELTNIQGQLALMQAVGDVTSKTGRDIKITGDQLNKWQSEVIAAGPRVLTSATDMNDAIVNLLSSVQAFDESEVVPSIEKFATGAAIAQTSVEELVTGVTQMNSIFGTDQNLKEYTKIVEAFVEIVRKVPGGKQYGRQFLLQLPGLATQAKAAGATPEEMMASYMTTARVLPPAIAARGLNFAFLSLFKPGNKDAAEALKGLGITPDSLVQPGPGGGPIGAFRKIFATIDPGSREGIMNMLKTGVTEEQAEEDPTEILRGYGIKGKDLALLSTIFTRTHGLRAFAAIAGQETTTGAGLGSQLEADLKLIHEVYSQTGTESKEVKDAMAEFNRMQPLKRLAVSLQNLRMQVEQDIAPGLNFAADAISNAMGQVLGKDWAKWGTFGALAAGAAIGGKRLIGGKGVPKAGGALLAASSLGDEGLGASPLNPMFVVVVGDITNLFSGRFLKKFGGKGAGKAAGEIDDVAKSAGKMGWLRRAAGSPWLRRGLKIGGGAAVVGSFLEPLIFPDEAGAGSDQVLSPAEQTKRRHDIHLQRARAMHLGGPGMNVLQLYRAQRMGEGKRAYVMVEVLLQHPDGKKEKRKFKVPAEFYAGGPAPSGRGQVGSRK